MSASTVDVRVRRAGAEDAPAFARLVADPGVFPQLLQMPHADEARWRARFAELGAPGSPDLLLVATVGDELVGGGGLHPVGASPRVRHAMSLGLHVRPEWQGRGIGRQLLQALCDYADDWLGLLRVELIVYTDNVAAQVLYRRFGFVDEGVHRCYALRAGEYVDALSMARLNPAPLRGFVRDRDGSAGPA